MLENQRWTAFVLSKNERPQRKGRIEIVPETKFVFKHPRVSGQRMLRCQYRYQDRCSGQWRIPHGIAAATAKLAIFIKSREPIRRQIHFSSPGDRRTGSHPAHALSCPFDRDDRAQDPDFVRSNRRRSDAGNFGRSSASARSGRFEYSAIVADCEGLDALVLHRQSGDLGAATRTLHVAFLASDSPFAPY